MPKSKRTKIVSLTKTTSNKKDLKEKVMDKLKGYFKKYNNVFLLDFQNLTNENQKKITLSLQGSLLFGKKSVLRVFFMSKMGQYPSLDQLVEKLEDKRLKDVCLFFTNSPKQEVLSLIKEFKSSEFAQPETIASATVQLAPGTEVFDSISSSNDAYLRNMGLFVTVRNGKLNLEEKFVAAIKSKPVTVVQSKILKMLGIKVGTFEAKPVCLWDKALDTFELF